MSEGERESGNKSPDTGKKRYKFSPRRRGREEVWKFFASRRMDKCINCPNAPSSPEVSYSSEYFPSQS